MLLLALLLAACSPALPPGADPYYLVGSAENRETLRGLFALLPREPEGSENEFAVIREIARNLARQGEYPRLVTFLTGRVAERPQDPYNTYYLFMTAFAYTRMDAYPAAALYFDRVVKNYPDMTIQDESIHLACLNQLITLVDSPERRVWYYEELISRFVDRIDAGAAYFMLGKAYEATGEWSGAIRAYAQYLPLRESNIPGYPNAADYARQLVDFSNSSKNWTYESQSALVAAVKTALDDGSSVQLERCRAKVNFFARTWEQEATDDLGMADFNLSDFMRATRIHYAPALDAGSNANEAYLRTWGWQNITTWYLYFRKIDFPQDPEIHGRWEWAGIYYGEKL